MPLELGTVVQVYNPDTPEVRSQCPTPWTGYGELPEAEVDTVQCGLYSHLLTHLSSLHYYQTNLNGSIIHKEKIIQAIVTIERLL